MASFSRANCSASSIETPKFCGPNATSLRTVSSKADFQEIERPVQPFYGRVLFPYFEVCRNLNIINNNSPFCRDVKTIQKLHDC